MKHMKRGSVADHQEYGKTGSIDKGSVAMGKPKRKMGDPSKEEREERTTAGAGQKKSKKRKGYKGHGFGMSGGMNY